MKKIIYLLIIIQSCFIYGQEEERPKPPRFIASDRAGIVYYEIEEVSENVKIKEDSDQFYEVAKAIRVYNRKVKEVAFLNSSEFKEIDEKLNKVFQRKPEDRLDPEAQEKEDNELKALKGVIPKARKK